MKRCNTRDSQRIKRRLMATTSIRSHCTSTDSTQHINKTMLELFALFVILSPVLGATVPPPSTPPPAHWKTPWFCHSNECPRFTVVETHTGYEMRHYEPSVWVSTSFNNVTLDKSVTSAMFFKLFHYIDSGNSEGRKIAMTSPVLDEIVALPNGMYNISMSFMVPFDLQANPPTPVDSTLQIVRLPAWDVYVKSFPGFDIDGQREPMAKALKQEISANHTYDPTRYYTAGYDSPFTFSNRHNEVWLRASS